MMRSVSFSLVEEEISVGELGLLVHKRQLTNTESISGISMRDKFETK